MKMVKIIVFSLASIMIMTAYGQDSKKKRSKKSKKSNVELTNEIDSASYCLGANFGMQLKQMGVSNWNAELMASAVTDVLEGNDTMFTKESIAQVLDTYFQKQKERLMKEAQKDLEGFLVDTATIEEKVITTASGLKYMEIKAGTGAKPTASDVVSTHYYGYLPNGEKFDSSLDRGEPTEFPVGQVIPGWTEALQLMQVGAKWKLIIPASLAYGENPGGGRPGGELIFIIELLEIK